MKDNKRIIGICLSKVEDDFRTDFLSYFHPLATENDYKLLVFNSPRDLYYGDNYDKGSKTIFNVINFEILDALIILDETFYDRETVNSVISRAREHKVPVILIHGEHEGCYCITTDYYDAYKDLLRHLFDVHGVSRPVFVGGRRQDDPHTELRLKCFREVLDEKGKEFSDDMVYYGDYWEIPTREAVRKLLAVPGETPDAIICANDTMAMSVCDELQNNGIRVPEDVKVTGFDGLIMAQYFMPRLSTCREDIRKLAEMTVKTAADAISGKLAPCNITEKYISYTSESCGCCDDSDIDYRERSRYLFKLTHEMKTHERHVYKWVDSVLDSDSLNTLSAALRDYILPGSSVCLNENFIMTALGQASEKTKEQSFNEYIVISSMSQDYSSGKQGRFPAADMIPDISGWLGDNTMSVLSPIFVGEETCGYYVVDTENITDIAHKLFRVSKTMNIAFGSLMNRLTKRNMQSSMLSARFTDALTGLPNLKGLNKWFDEFTAVGENHNKHIMVSVYSIPQYKFIYENYGMDDIEEAVKFTSDALRLANKDNGVIARTGNDEFVIINYVDNESDISVIINNAVSVFFGVIEGYNSSSDKEYFLEVNCGCTVANAGWNSSLSTLIKLADAEMYMNKLKAGLTPVMKDEKIQNVADAKTPKDLYSEFTILIKKNMFTYFFQPIIDAKTGEIYAYEALMRTKGGIKMSPLEILDIAKEYNMLYEIEKATMFNVMDRYSREREKFSDSKVFINTIPGNFLKQDDLAELKEKYGKYISNFVFEITEQDTVTDDELNSIRSLGIIGNSEEFKDAVGGQIAVDDYGTGHSNIVNLLRYAPHIIKIDRFLISNIQNDPNKQMFVKSTIEFAKMNNIKVLAEGVETFEEMKTVIEYGVDLIQGYYTARPAEEPIPKIPDSIRNEVITENLNLTKYENESLIYHAQDGETIGLYELALKKYGSIRLGSGSYTIVGTEGQFFDTEIKIESGSNIQLVLDTVNIKALEEPVIQLGKECRAVITLKGSNMIQKNGILVPSGSSLRFNGDGDLNVSVKRNDGVGIGNNYECSFGELIFSHTGCISVEVRIDSGVCIGGGSENSNGVINVESGTINVSAQCVNSLGVGCVKGKARINVFEGATVKARCTGKNSVGIGSFEGGSYISTKGFIDVISDGERSAACGTIGTGAAVFTSDDGECNAVVHGDNAVCVGSLAGKATVNINGGRVTAYGEGDSVCGYGSSVNSAFTRISGGTASVRILSGNIMMFGSDECKTIITGGNIITADERKVTAVNGFDEPLHPEFPEGESYTRKFVSDAGEYVYTAHRHEKDDTFCVFVP